MNQLGCVVLLLVAALPICTGQRWRRSWTYNCTEGEAAWGGPYFACDQNPRVQSSPIDIRTTESTKNYRDAIVTRELDVRFVPGRWIGSTDLLLELKPSGEDQIVAVNWEEEVDDEQCSDCAPQTVKKEVEYKASRIVFHHPSEHTVDGKRYPLEVQIFLKVGDEMESAVVSSFGIVTEKDLVTLDIQEVAEDMLTFSPTSSSLKKQFNAASLLPQAGGFFSYEGSDTAPPCGRNLRWFIAEHTTNFTSSMVTALKGYIQQMHPLSTGNARPLRVQGGAQISHFTGFGEILKSASVERITPTQHHQHLTETLYHPSILNMDPAYLYQEPYHLTHNCVKKVGKQPNPWGTTTPNTHPDVLHLNPDVVMAEQLRSFLVPPEPVVVRKPLPNPGSAANNRAPSKRVADWAATEADNQRKNVAMSRCKTIPLAQMSPSEAAECRTLLSQSAGDVWVFTDVVPPPPPARPIKEFDPSNWHLGPSTLDEPFLPDQLNPYNPWASRLAPKDVKDPMSGEGQFMHTPHDVITPYIKPVLSYPPVYDGEAESDK